MAKSVNGGGCGDEEDSTTPICRCRVLYLGSAVPHITKDGLQGIQEPLRDLYPEQGVFWNADRDHTATGIDSWLSVWSNGILVENVDDKGNTVRRFHPIESLHYCAAVRYVSVPAGAAAVAMNDAASSAASSDGKIAKFLPLDSPFSKSTVIEQNAGHPPLFACILRRTSGIKVLECHAFICKKEAAANALVRCCFHAYADTMHARQIEIECPYERLDKRRSRSIGSALDSQSLIEEKINSWQKNSTGGSSSGGTPEEANGYGDNRSISRQKARTPSVASLVSHSMADVHNGLPPAHHHHHHHAHHEPIYYNGGIGNGTLRSVRSFMSLATLKSQKKLRPRQIPIPITAAPPLPPPPVMFATLTKKELKKVLKKESTLKRKHKYKDFPGPFLAPNGIPIIYGPPPPPPTLPSHPGPIYGTLPPPMPGPYYTLDRKGRIAPPQPMENGHMLPPPPPSQMEEPIYMPTMPSPNGTLRPLTPHGEPIYFDPRSTGPPPLPPHMSPPPPMFFHPQTGMPCTFMPATTLSRKELKELEKQKAAMKKAAKKESKKKAKNGKVPNGHDQQTVEEIYQQRAAAAAAAAYHYEMQQNGHHPHLHPPPPPPPPPPMQAQHPEEIMVMSADIQQTQPPPPGAMVGTGMATANYNGNSANGGIYKKKGHLNERAFSYSIRQEHRSRSNSLSNLAFENGNGCVASNGGGPSNGDVSNHASCSSLKSSDTGHHHHHHQNGLDCENGKPYQNGRLIMNGGEGIDPNALVSRMSNLKLNGNGTAHPPPPPPPLPSNGYQYKKTATIKRL